MFIISNLKEVRGHYSLTFGTQVKALMFSLKCQACMFFFFTFCHGRGSGSHVTASVTRSPIKNTAAPAAGPSFLCCHGNKAVAPLVVLHLFFNARSSVRLSCCAATLLPPLDNSSTVDFNHPSCQGNTIKN